MVRQGLSLTQNLNPGVWISLLSSYLHLGYQQYGIISVNDNHNRIDSCTFSIIFPRHQIWYLLYNLVTPIEAHSCITKHHIFNQKAQQESSVLQDCSDIKIMYMSHDKVFISIELTPNGCVTLLVVQGVFSQKNAWLCRCDD